jgi:hypothetical protein
MNDELSTVAWHEASHSVVRWVTCGIAARTWICPETFCGESEGSSERIPIWADILIALAGPASETGFGLASIDLMNSSSEDISHAKEMLLADGVHQDAIADAMEVNYRSACEVLLSNLAAVEELAYQLADRHVLSKEEVQAVLQRLAPR